MGRRGRSSGSEIFEIWFGAAAVLVSFKVPTLMILVVLLCTHQISIECILYNAQVECILYHAQVEYILYYVQVDYILYYAQVECILYYVQVKYCDLNI